jgi:hypothetical protein
MRLALRDTNATFVLTRKAKGLGPREAVSLGPKGSGSAGRAHVVKAGL